MEPASVRCCPLSANDGDRPAAYAEETRRARKEHDCTECGLPIRKGDRYEYVSGIWDGSPSSFKTCMLCVEIRTHFACSGGWLFGCLWEDLAENFFPEMKCGGPCMQGLSPAAKTFLIEQRMEWLLEHDEIDDGAWEGWPAHKDRQRAPAKPIPLYDDDDEAARPGREREMFW